MDSDEGSDDTHYETFLDRMKRQRKETRNSISKLYRRRLELKKRRVLKVVKFEL